MDGLHLDGTPWSFSNTIQLSNLTGDVGDVIAFVDVSLKMQNPTNKL